jgi:hypothetical protein
MPVTITTDLKRLRALSKRELKIQKQIKETPPVMAGMRNSLLWEQREILREVRSLLV